MEQSFVMLKPDCVNRSLVGEVISRFEKKGMKLVAMKFIRMDKALCQKHYSHHVTKPFYPRLEEFMTSSPIVVMVWEGKSAVEVVRKLCGATNSREALPGTIRGDLSMSVQSNIVHASDSLETAYAEIERFFKPEELQDYPTIWDKISYAEDESKNREKIKSKK